MKKTYPITVSMVVGAALLCLMPHEVGFAQSYSIRPTCNSSSQCKPNTVNFGFNDTNWRQWPAQSRPEEQDPKTVGGIAIPTPPPITEQPLPHAEELPAKPPLSGGNTEGGILPFQGLTPGPLAAPESLKIGGGTAALPNNPKRDTTEKQNPQAPSGLQGIPEGLDLVPGQPSATPKKEGASVEPQIPSKEPLLPGGITPDVLTPTPGTAAVEPSKTPEKSVPTPKPSTSPPNLVPTPAAKPDEPLPSQPIPGSSLWQPSKGAVVAKAKPNPDDLPIRADWNASLGPEAAGENRLRSASFEQCASETGNPLRCSLQGYCPVQLQENDRWVAGNRDFEMSYQGQVFRFSSDAARKRFEAAPEKYAPAHSGNDIVLAVEENRTVPGSVNHSAVWHGRLYLFSTSATLATFQQDPARYANGPRQTPLLTPVNSL